MFRLIAAKDLQEISSSAGPSMIQISARLQPLRQ